MIGCLSKHFSTFTVMFEVWYGDTWIQQAYDMSLNSFLKTKPQDCLSTQILASSSYTDTLKVWIYFDLTLLR